MPNLVIKPAAQSGNKVIIQDQAGGAVLTTADSGVTIENATFPTIKLTPGSASGSPVEGQLYYDSTSGLVKLYNGSEWAQLAGGGDAYGIEFLVIGGGGSGGSSDRSGGGGAGGYRTSSLVSLPGTKITITVGDGAAGVSAAHGLDGSPSSFSGTGLITISAAGGGGGNSNMPPPPVPDARDGGSGGGAGYGNAGSGNVPSTSPAQGYDGGEDYPGGSAGGGGGSSEAGEDGSVSSGGDGGDGTTSSISGSSVTRAGGGGGGSPALGVGNGGTGGGGAAGLSNYVTHIGEPGVSGTVNTGSGGGAGGTGAASQNPGQSGAGGKGVVILSMPDANYSGTIEGAPTVATGQAGGKTTLIFTGTGTYTT